MICFRGQILVDKHAIDLPEEHLRDKIITASPSTMTEFQDLLPLLTTETFPSRDNHIVEGAYGTYTLKHFTVLLPFGF